LTLNKSKKFPLKRKPHYQISDTTRESTQIDREFEAVEAQTPIKLADREMFAHPNLEEQNEIMVTYNLALRCDG